MPVTNTSFIRSTIILLVVGLVALLGIVGTTIWLVDRNQGYADLILEARIARSAAVNVRTSLLDGETAQRGFLLTREESYLAPYETAVENRRQQVERLEAVLKPYPEADARMQAFKEIVDAKFLEMARTIDMAKSGDVVSAVEIVRTDAGKARMDEARAFLDDVIATADEVVIQGIGDQNNASNALRWVSVLGGVVIILVVGGSAWTSIVYTRELLMARGEVEVLNAGLEERVRERTQDLGRANEEIQRFAYIVTHDLRAPLVNIMGFTSELETSLGAMKAYWDKVEPAEGDMEAAEARLAATEDVPEAIGFIRSSTRKMDGLINAILKISREGRRALSPERIDLQKLVEAAAASLQHQVVEDDGRIDIDIKVPAIVSDKLALEQVLGNLLDNAVKYRQPGRPLVVTVRAREALAGQVTIEVADNGRGIAATDHERVFELFRRSGTQDKAGEGIGLAHVRGICRNLGGDITLTSEFGQGTTFRIILPRDLRAHVRNSGK